MEQLIFRIDELPKFTKFLLYKTLSIHLESLRKIIMEDWIYSRYNSIYKTRILL